IYLARPLWLKLDTIKAPIQNLLHVVKSPAHLYRGYPAMDTTNLSEAKPTGPALLLVIIGVLLYSTLSPFLYETFSHLRRIPGPLAARLSRFWYLSRVSTGRFHFTSIDLHQKYGSIVRIAPRQYSLSDPSVVKQIYGIGHGFPKSEWYHASSVPNAEWKDLFTDLDSTRHAANRRVVANLYSATALRDMEPNVEECINQYVAKLERMAETGEQFNLQFWMQCYAFDVICQITLGERYGFLDTGRDNGDIFSSLHAYLKYCALVGIEHEWHNIGWWILNQLPASGLAKVAQFTIQALVKNRSTYEKQDVVSRNTRKDFLAKLLRLQEADPRKFPDSAVFTTCITNIGAGSDTTSISLCAVLDYLVLDEICLEKLRNEVDAKFAELGNPEHLPFKDTQAMPYFQACIKEALRLHPATGLPLARTVPEGGATLSGTFFPAGSTVGINAWVIQRDKSVFGADANAYRPERWLISDKAALSNMEKNWMPFGAGSRTCIGKNISLLEMNKLVPSLIRRFDFKRQTTGEMKHENFWFVKQMNLEYKVAARKSVSM
ncbi:unnamed protein product, partial [Clonostachys rosea]